MLAGLRSAARSAARAVLAPAARGMSVFTSPSVQRWLGERAIEAPTSWRPWKWAGKWRGPELSRRKQALLVKEAIRRGEVQLEPTVMPPPPKFKGHAREKQRPITRAHVAEKMEAMPKMIADFRRARREKLEKRRAAERWK